MEDKLNGILLIDKPEGYTSHDVVAKLRGILRERRIGHSGTLDPMATGLLLVFVGRATRAVEFAESDVKRYRASIRLGLETDTLDTTGKVLSERDASAVTSEDLGNILNSFRGEQEQIPPMYSALKQNGKKLYELAREGKTAERKARKINISLLELVGVDDKGDFILDVECSKGTYIRSLCADIGEALGCGACMSALRRTNVGAFSVTNASVLEGLERDKAVSLMFGVESIFGQHEKVTVTASKERVVRNGGTFDCEIEDGVYRIYAKSGEFLALYEMKSGRAKSIKSFFEV